MRVDVGVLALQGAFREHAEAFRELGADVHEVRLPGQLDGLDAIVLPGGESSVMSKLLVTSGVLEPLRGLLADGLPALATCAGLVLVAREVLDGVEGQVCLGLLDAVVRRNAYGSQVASFEAPIDVDGLDGGPFTGVFIRAPGITRTGAGVEVLARLDGDAVAVRQGRVVATTFHPELSGDRRLHRWFIAEVLHGKVGATPPGSAPRADARVRT